jgi:hypothetical protein
MTKCKLRIDENGRSLWKYPVLILITLFFIGLSVMLRFPYLYEWDSVNYVKALDEFNLFLNQPHPPGYVGFVFILKVGTSIFQDSFTAFLAIILLSYVVFALFSTLLAKELFDIEFDSGLYGFFLSVPIVFFHSQITTIYLTEGAVVVLIVYCLFKVLKGKWNPFWILLILPGGLIKTNIPLVLLPLAIFVLFFRIKGPVQKWIVISLLIIADILWYFTLNDLVFYLSRAPDVLDALITDYIFRDNILSGFLGGIKNLVLTVVKNIKNVILALVIQLLPLVFFLGVRSSRRSLLKSIQNRHTWFLMFWILPHLGFILLFYFPKNGYLLEIFSGLVLLYIGFFRWEQIRVRFKWIVAANLLLFFIPVQTDYFKAKIKISGQDKSRSEYIQSQIIRVFETTYSHSRSIKNVYEYYFREIKRLKKQGRTLIILNNIISDYRVIPHYMNEEEFLIVQKTGTHFLISSFKQDNTSIRLIERSNPTLILKDYERIYLITSTPDRYSDSLREVSKTVFRLIDNTIDINGLEIRFPSQKSP